MKKYFDKLYRDGQTEFYNEIETDLKDEKRKFIVTANPETFMIGERDPEMGKLLLDNDTTLVPDGIGIVKAAQMMHYNIRERIAGIDIAYKLLEFGHQQKKSIYLFGAKPEVVADLVKVIRERYPDLNIAGTDNGYVNEKDAVFEKMKKLEPDIILVALGIPVQEKLIYKHLKDFKKGIFVGVGGSFDVISGHKKRAPQIFINLKLEWLYRIVTEPQRLKRFYESNVKFIFKTRRYRKEQ